MWKKSILHLKNSGIVTQGQQKSHCSQLRPIAFLLPFWRSNSNFFLPFPLFMILHFKGWHVSLNPKFLWLVQNWDTTFKGNEAVWKNKVRSTILVLIFFLFLCDEWDPGIERKSLGLRSHSWDWLKTKLKHLLMLVGYFRCLISAFVFPCFLKSSQQQLKLCCIL